jgi:CDP-diacylglycerol--glycerol-3-phosphate 3-phosphatidyltransferase
MVLGKQAIRERTRRILDPVVALLASMGVPPVLVSILGLVGSLFAAYVVSRGSLFWGGIWTLVSGICDMLDGSLARRRGQVTKFGAFIDSTFDRASEFVIYGAILLYFLLHYSERGYPLVLLTVIWVAMGGSFLVSYARARIEGLGHQCTVGLLERPERLTLLVVGLVLGRTALVVALVLIAFGAVITVLQRIQHAYQVMRRES